MTDSKSGSLCPHCGKAVTGGTFCGGCGKALGSRQAAAAPAPAPVWSVVVGDTLPPIQQFLAGPAPTSAPCPKCQSPLPAGAHFCGACGANLA